MKKSKKEQIDRVKRKKTQNKEKYYNRKDKICSVDVRLVDNEYCSGWVMNYKYSPDTSEGWNYIYMDRFYEYDKLQQDRKFNIYSEKYNIIRERYYEEEEKLKDAYEQKILLIKKLIIIYKNYNIAEDLVIIIKKKYRLVNRFYEKYKHFPSYSLYVKHNYKII